MENPVDRGKSLSVSKGDTMRVLVALDDICKIIVVKKQ